MPSTSNSRARWPSGMKLSRSQRLASNWSSETGPPRVTPIWGSPSTRTSRSPWAFSVSCRASIRPRLHSVSSRAPTDRISRLTRLRARISPPRREPPNRRVRRRRPALAGADGSAFAVAVSDAIQGLDRVELGIDDPELLAHALDVAVDGPVVDVDLVVVGGVHQVVAALHEAGPLGQRLKQQELGHGQLHGLAVPGALVARRVHGQLAAADGLVGAFGRGL